MKLKKVLIPIILILIGESIFILPFLVTRIFRPSFLKVFDINNFQLGTAFSIYGVVAMVSYFFGGQLADRFSPKKLLSVSLFVTAIGGFIMVYIPSLSMLNLLYGAWGVTTILLFWAAYIKAIRLFWNDSNQGKGFGVVDAGRGLMAALLASISVLIFESFLPEVVETASLEELSTALSYIILLFTGITLVCAVLVSALFSNQNEQQQLQRISISEVMTLLKKRSIWLNSLIVLCSYVGYKCTDDFSLYASEVLGFNDVDAAHVGTISFWTRPFAALFAGFLGDRFIHSKIVQYCFFLMLVCSTLISLGILNNSLSLFSVLLITTTSVGIYGLRGLYFALLQEAKIPILLTGSAVGLISVIGYTPDIFMGPLMGYILDRSPGVVGHQQLFGVLSFFCIVGIICTYLFRKSYKIPLKT